MASTLAALMYSLGKRCKRSRAIKKLLLQFINNMGEKFNKKGNSEVILCVLQIWISTMRLSVTKPCLYCSPFKSLLNFVECL